MLKRLTLAATVAAIAVTTTVAASPRPTVQFDGAELPWPDRRFAPCGALDPEDGALYAFGGRADDGATHLGDLLALDLGHESSARPAWTLATGTGAPGAPPPVRTSAAAWDPAGRLLVFGGWNGVTHDGGVRAFDPATGQWQVLCDATSCGPPPAARRASQVVVDHERRRLLLFGGTNGKYFDDVWALSLDELSWARLETEGPRPAARGGHSMVVDPGRDAGFMFGGTRSGPDLGDVWRFDLAADRWTPLAPQCPSGCPTPRSGATLVLDEPGRRLVLCGGWESAGNVYRRESWTLEQLDGVPAWRPLAPASESPQARFFPVGGYDPLGRQLVVFGGGANGSAYKDAFGLTLPAGGSPATWHTLSPTTPLSARDQVTVVLDQRVLTAFGGFGSGTFPGTIDAGTHLADTWQRALDRKAGWRLATPTDEGAVLIAREGTAYALDEAAHRLLLFGGLTGDTTLADVWAVDLRRPGRPRWVQVCSPTSCGTGPSARWGAHAVYDAASARFVVFGGLTASGATANDVWALDLDGTPKWEQMAPAGPRPPARWSAAYGFDAARRRLVVFGGQTGPDATGTSLQDTWALSLAGSPAWEQLATTGPRPSPRRSPAAAIRRTATGSELVVATGLTTAGGLHHDDVWALDLGGDGAAWTELDPDGDGDGPEPRRSASAVYDAVTDRLIVTFGRDATEFFADTWAFDFATGSWSRRPG